jgi:uncharacterized protein (TIGR03067 family)
MRRFCTSAVPFAVVLLAVCGRADAAEKLVFVGIVGTGDDGHRLGIVIMDADGSHRVALTKDDHREYDPALSPDGTRIAFVRDGDSVWVMNTDGTGREKVGRRFVDWRDLDPDNRNADYTLRGKVYPGNSGFRSPSWSPDGKRIAYFNFLLGYSGGGSYEPAVADADGKKTLRNNTVLENAEGVPTWSRDGKQILFGSSAGGSVLTDADCKRATHLGRLRAAALSPDGKRLLYASGQGFGEWGLFVADADGKNEKPLTKTPAARAAWSPDGKQVAFVTPWGIKEDKFELGNLRVCPAGGGDSSPLTKTGDVVALRWSADGKRIFFNCYQSSEKGKDRLSIFVIDADGKNEKELSKGDCWDALEGVLAVDWTGGTLVKAFPLEERASKDADRLQGVWRVVRSERGGEDDTRQVKGQVLVFEKDTVTLNDGDEVLYKGIFKLVYGRDDVGPIVGGDKAFLMGNSWLGVAVLPQGIDITLTEGRHKGEKVLGIWEMGKDSLRWCVAGPGEKDRPLVFYTDKNRQSEWSASFEKRKP